MGALSLNCIVDLGGTDLMECMQENPGDAAVNQCAVFPIVGASRVPTLTAILFNPDRKLEWLRTQSSQTKANVSTSSKLSQSALDPATGSHSSQLTALMPCAEGAFAKQDNGQPKADVKGKGKAEGEGTGFGYPELGAKAEKKAEEAEAKEVQAEAGANPAVAVGEAKAE